MHAPPPPSKSWRSPSGRAFAAVIAGNAILALGPWMVRLADVGPVAAGFWRLALALPVLTAIALWRRRGQAAPPASLWAMLAAGGLFFALDLAFWHVRIHRTRLANATLFGNVTSFTYPLYGYLVARTWPGRNAGGALLLAAAGVALLLGRSYEMSPERLAGDAFALFAGLCYTGYIVAIGRIDGRMPPLTALAATTATGTLPLLAAALLLGERVWPGDWTPLLALALGSQLIGQGLMVYAVGQLAPVVVGLSLLLQPVIAASVGWIAYGERLGLLDLIGALAVAAALVLVRRPDRALGSLRPAS